MDQEVNQLNHPRDVFRPKAHEGKGRRTAVAPGTTAARFLHYGRITLAAGDPPLKFNNNDHEVGLICLNGKASVRAEGAKRLISIT